MISAPPAPRGSPHAARAAPGARGPSRAAASCISRRRENIVGVNMVLAEYHQNTLN